MMKKYLLILLNFIAICGIYHVVTYILGHYYSIKNLRNFDILPALFVISYLLAIFILPYLSFHYLLKEPLKLRLVGVAYVFFWFVIISSFYNSALQK
ncbi:hypothetical protein [Emticicia agri]|uniref:Uncharacterized protein n=1 Tax=Emticicia agri TaxID=2492393 RepID=A0A4Q5LVX0_9BACT|nr:hypothetical protein [Emticicia agri]RYU93623.1 hypothetical protein EWM59_21045 [Emticicia agri]